MSALVCPECGSPLASDQRYCVNCGARSGPPSPQLSALLARVARRSEPPAADPPSPPVTSVPPRRRSAGGWAGAVAGLRLPSPWVSAALVLGFLGFGTAMGAAAASSVDAGVSASARQVRVLVPASSAAAPSSSPSGSGEANASPSGSGEPESTEAEPVATPAPTKPSTAGNSPTESGGGGGESEQKPAAKTATKLPAIGHVFVIVLSDQPYASVFGPVSAAPYLSSTLEHSGELLVHYDAVAHEQLANGIALLSGQGPTPETAADCPIYSDLAATGTGAHGQVLGNGCVYPAATPTLPGQLAAKHLSWRAYIQGIGESPGQTVACAHPALGQSDPAGGVAPAPGPYAAFLNPFLYFHSIVDAPACASEQAGLGALKTDLARPSRTPRLAYIVPDRCHDASPEPCVPGSAAGLIPADALLREIVPEIMASKAYKKDGLLVITVDEAPSGGEFADSSSCCSQPRFPNLPAPSGGLSPRGGGAVGALLLSPFIKKAGTSQEPYDHFSLLRTIEDVFALKHLGYAGLSGVKSFEPSIFSAGG